MKESSPVLNRHVFLLGRPPLSEYIGVVKAQHGFNNKQIADHADYWRTASVRVNELQTSESGIADNPKYQDLPESMTALAERALSDPIFEQAFNVVKPVVRMVELDTLVTFQKHVNLDFIEDIKKQLGKNPSDEELFKLCIPVDHPLPPIASARVDGDAFMFVSPSADIRVLEANLLSPEQIPEIVSSGPVAATLGLTVGTGANCLTGLFINGRMVLNNGSHRAYALKALGYTHAPAIVLQVTSHEEMEMLAPEQFMSDPAAYLETPRPSILKDYFDENLRTILHVPKKNRQVKISYKIEVIDVPVV